jgi:hypothetical protein
MYKQAAAIGALAAAFALATQPAVAQDRGRVDSNDNVRGFYLGGAIGDFNSNLNSPDDADDVDLDFGDQDADRIYAGWRFNRWAAFELDYTDFGRSNAGPNQLGISAESDGVTPAIVGTLPIGPIELFAKAGMMFYNVSVNDNNDNVLDDSGHDPVYGVGIGFTIAEHLNLRAEYERVDIDAFDDANAVWLSANWRF